MEHEQALNNLVIGLAGPYGAGCSSLREELKNVIHGWPNCHLESIRVSQLIPEYYKILLGSKLDIPNSDSDKRRALQGAGTQLRQIDKELIGKIITWEIYNRGQKLNEQGMLKDCNSLIFIVDSLKNAHDLYPLKNIYGEEFYFCFVHANRENRWRRMRNYKSWQEKEREIFQNLDDIDRDQKSKDPDVQDAGQQVCKLSSLADYYIVNNSNLGKLHKDAERFFQLLMDDTGGSNQPTFHESAMHQAYSAANKSYCLSRQVGAALYDQQGNILGLGHNDVPKPGGGLYSLEDKNDSRCFLTGDRRCISDTNKQERFDKVVDQLCSISPISNYKDKITGVVKNSPFKEAIEFCRAVHAEMEAILNACRNSGISTINSHMYVTTEPCHNCTKHIICAGVKMVFYIEPYPKSLAEEFHSDAIILDPENDVPPENKVAFIPYQGVAPHRFHDFFRIEAERKDSHGKMLRRSREDQANSPRFSKRLSKRSRLEGDTTRITFNEAEVATEIQHIICNRAYTK